MTSKLGGRPTKDAPISDAFNQLKVGDVLTKKDISAAKRAARMEKLRQDEEKRKQKENLARLADQVARVTAKLGDVPVVKEEKEEITETEVTNAGEDPQSDEKSAHKMLLDLRYAYRNSKGPGGKKGKQRLVELMENDADFKFAVKELLKIEAALMAAKIRKDGSGEGLGVGQQNFFVVLKGLESERPMLEAMSDKTVDMKQIQRAMNPEENSYEPEEEVNQRDAPEQLQKKVEGL
jgi:hypothetical protein